MIETSNTGRGHWVHAASFTLDIPGPVAHLQINVEFEPRGALHEESPVVAIDVGSTVRRARVPVHAPKISGGGAEGHGTNHGAGGSSIAGDHRWGRDGGRDGGRGGRRNDHRERLEAVQRRGYEVVVLGFINDDESAAFSLITAGQHHVLGMLRNNKKAIISAQQRWR